MIYQNDAARRDTVKMIAKHAVTVGVLDALERVIHEYAETKKTVQQTYDEANHKREAMSLDGKELEAYFGSIVPIAKEKIAKLQDGNKQRLKTVDKLLSMLEYSSKQQGCSCDSLPTYDGFSYKYTQYLGPNYCTPDKCVKCFYNWICDFEGGYKLTKEADSIIQTYQDNLKKPAIQKDEKESVNIAEFNRVCAVVDLQLQGKNVPEQMMKTIPAPKKKPENQFTAGIYSEGEWKN